MRKMLIQAALLAVSGKAAFVALVAVTPIAPVALAVLAIAVMGVIVIPPLRLMLTSLTLDGSRVPTGFTYVAAYCTKSFAVRLPHGRKERFLYAEIQQLLSRASFVIFEMPIARRRIVLPLAILPNGDHGWLVAHVRDTTPTAPG
jgi:hypothetical protein